MARVPPGLSCTCGIVELVNEDSVPFAVSLCQGMRDITNSTVPIRLYISTPFDSRFI
jgi:hypothetical protein